MPEPISIISITALALSAARTTKDFVDGIIDAPNSVIATSRDLEALNTILTLLFTQLQDPVFKDVQALDPIVTMLEAPLKNCTEETEKLRGLLSQFIKPSGAAKTGKWTRFTFRYREADITTIQQRLSNYRASLDAAVGIAVLIISARSSQKVQLAGTGIDTIQRRIQRLLLHAGLDSSTASTSSYAASQLLDSSNDTRIADWLHETETVANVSVDEDQTLWYPDIVIGIDVGHTCTGVAYALNSDFQRTIIFNEWPVDNGRLPYDKVRTTVAYDKRSGKLLKPGLGLNWYFTNKDITVHEWASFPYKWQIPLLPSREQTWFKDFLSCLYDYLSVHLNKILPEWNQRTIEFVFSIPQYYRDSTDRSQIMERLIKYAGFAASSKHEVRMITAERAILSAVNLPKNASTVLTCDVGGRTACISIRNISPDVADWSMEAISCSNTPNIGSAHMEIDHVHEIMNKRLVSFRKDIKNNGLFELNLMLHYGKDFATFYQREWEAFKHSYSPESVKGPDFVLSLPDVELRMSSAEVQDMFDKELEESVDCIEQGIYRARNEHGLRVDCIVLSGGLGASPYIQWKIQNQFAGKIEVLVDAEAHTAATRGLVISRLRELGLVPQNGEQQIRKSRE